MTRRCVTSTPRRISVRPRSASACSSIQYWGGPTTYSDQRGHPRLRMRHAPFAVTPVQRDRWLTHMRDAIDSLDHLTAEQGAELWCYMERSAHFMVNTLDDSDPGPRPGLQIG